MADENDVDLCNSPEDNHSPFDINDTQARFVIIRNFYEEVTCLLLKRFLLIRWFRATGEKLNENSDILFTVLQHLQLPTNHVLKKDKKYGEQLYLKGTPQKKIDISKFDLSLTLTVLQELECFPSSKNHTCCIFCEPSCTKFKLKHAAKEECNDCEFCRPSGNCYSDKLKTSLQLAKKNRNAGAHSSKSQCSSSPLSAEDIDKHIRALKFLYEYLYTNNNWRNFNNEWRNYDAFHKMKEKIELIKESSIEFLTETFKNRLSLQFRILTKLSNMDQRMCDQFTNQREETKRLEKELQILKEQKSPCSSNIETKIFQETNLAIFCLKIVTMIWLYNWKPNGVSNVLKSLLLKILNNKQSTSALMMITWS